jgi:RHS repeat-associated protein
MKFVMIRAVTNTTPSGTTVYFYNQDGHPIAEYDGSTGTLKREYIWLGDTPIAVVDAGSPSTTYYVHTDHLNRPIAMSNAAKSFVARYVWEPFGNSYSYTGTAGIDLRFPGQMFQAESGLHYNWFRQYDPTIGRYTQPDPLGLEAGIGRYAYVNNDPLQQTDQQGLAPRGAPMVGLPGQILVTGKGDIRLYDMFGNRCLDLDYSHNHYGPNPVIGPHYHTWNGTDRDDPLPLPQVKF